MCEPSSVKGRENPRQSDRTHGEQQFSCTHKLRLLGNIKREKERTKDEGRTGARGCVVGWLQQIANTVVDFLAMCVSVGPQVLLCVFRLWPLTTGIQIASSSLLTLFVRRCHGLIAIPTLIYYPVIQDCQTLPNRLALGQNRRGQVPLINYQCQLQLGWL